jgi:hypothetical protein
LAWAVDERISLMGIEVIGNTLEFVEYREVSEVLFISVD